MNELQHHGILGQKWGVRRFQNADGSLTAEGKSRYKSEKTAEDYRQAGDKHKQRAKDAAGISIKAGMSTIPLALGTIGATAVSAGLNPVALGLVTVSMLMSGTAAVSKFVAIGEAAVSALNYSRAKKLES